MTNSLSIAICGIRGIPARYGGFETFAEELGVRLVERGHKVRVYGRKHLFTPPQASYRGVSLRLLPAPRHKYLETPVHTLLCLFDLWFRPVDAVLVCNAANSPFLWLAKLRRIPNAVNVDGIERMRGKWNRLGRMWYRLGERCSVLFADRIVADAQVIADYYRTEHRAASTIIAYGFRPSPEGYIATKLAGTYEPASAPVLAELGIKPDKYLLFVSRLEPENNAHRVIAAYNSLPEEAKKLPLVIVGDAPYAKEYIEELHALAGPGVIFAGYRFGDSYVELQQNALAYIQATEVGGTHPALVEAMGFGNCIIVNGTPENVEVLGGCGLIYRKNDEAELKARLLEIVSQRSEVLKWRARAWERAQAVYSWENICSDYEKLFYELSHKNSRV